MGCLLVVGLLFHFRFIDCCLWWSLFCDVCLFSLLCRVFNTYWLMIVVVRCLLCVFVDCLFVCCCLLFVVCALFVDC